MPIPTTALAFAIVFIAGAGLSAAHPCSQEILIQCTAPLRILSDNQELGFATKKEDLDQLCPDLNAGLRCVDEYTRRCMSPHQRSHFNKLYAGSSMVMQEICQEGPYQEEFLRHANCMLEVKEDYEECARDYQSKLQDLNRLLSNESSDAENEHHVRKLCCSFQEYLQCSHAIVKDTCGEEAAIFTRTFLDRMSSSLIQVHCEKYPQGSQICTEDVSGSSLLQPSAPCLLVLLLVGLLLRPRWT